jgi:hypothetical protein
MKANDALTNTEWLRDVRDALQQQSEEIQRLRAALIAIIQVTRAPGVQPIPDEPADWEVHRIANWSRNE